MKRFLISFLTLTLTFLYADVAEKWYEKSIISSYGRRLDIQLQRQ